MFYPVSASTDCAFDTEVLTPIGSGAHLFIANSYLYVAVKATDLLKIYDISNPASPVLRSSTSLGASKGPVEIVVRGNYAFMIFNTSSELAIWDISSPTAPTQTSLTALTGFATANTPGHMVVSSDGNQAYISYSAVATVASGHKAVGKYDTTNKAAPSAGSKWIDGSANAVWLSGLSLVESFSSTLLFVSGFRYASAVDGQGAFYSVTTSTMATNGYVLLGALTGSSAFGELSGISAGYFYTFDVASNKIYPINATTPASPTAGAAVSLGAGSAGTPYPNDYRLISQILYVGMTNGTTAKGVYPVNVSTRMTPSVGAVISSDTDQVSDVKIIGDECVTLAFATSTGLQQIYLKGNP